ncbi:MAG: phosphate ABC transporter permease subunit PstC [Planctomycetes bacterium]|nr:phosphate ABC transporter permease subunit PstC [Planctomycetota bacterium]
MTSPPTARAPRSQSWGDTVFGWLCQSAGGFVLAIAATLVLVLVIQSWPVLSNPSKFRLLTSADWNPEKDSYGALVFIYGTLATSLIALLIAVPLGVGAAAYLSELAPGRVRKTCAFLLELLAAIPSVVYGFWAREFLAKQGLAPLFDSLGLPNVAAGQGILAAGLVLAVMILPYITAVSFDVCQAVPRSQREGAFALGSSRWQTIWRVVLPFARPGIIAGCFLALGRAIGETMAVTMVIANSSYLDFHLNATGDTIPSVIAKELFEAGGVKKAALVALGLLLLAITLVMNIAGRAIIGWSSRPSARPGRRPIQIAEGLQAPAPRTLADVEASQRKAQRWDTVMRLVLACCQFATVVPLFLILGYIAVRGVPGVNWDFFTKLPNDSPGRGLSHALYGSVILVGMAAAFAIPIGLLTAIFLAEYRTHRMTGPVRFVAELLGGVPSIVIGIFGYALLVYPFWGNEKWGFSAWAGAFALGVMMLPVVIRASEEAMRLVPNSPREASYALGASRRQTVLKVILPAAMPTIITGVFLAIGRVAGETAPLILTARGSQFFPRSLSDPTPSLPYYIYDFSKYAPGSAEIGLAWTAAFVLVTVVVLLNVGVRLIAGKRVVAAARAD